MNKWKLTFIFLTGFWLHEVMVHVWLGLDGLLPFTSKLFPWLTITNEFNTFAIAFNFALTLLFAYFGFLHSWGTQAHVESHA